LTEPVDAERVLVLAPAGRDAELACSALTAAGIAALACPDMDAFCQELALGAGVGVLTEEVLAPGRRQPLVEELARQPVWADFPMIVLVSRPTVLGADVALTRALSDLGNTTLLDRPLHPDALVSTVRAALRARLRQYQSRELLSRLERGVKERDQFLATLSHELRNPLGAIRNAMVLIKEGVTAHSALERPVAVVDRQVTHLVRLIDDLLDVARVTTGKVVLQTQRVDLRAVIQQAAQQLEPTFEQHGLRLFTALGPRPLWVDGDPVRLEQIVTNLLMNSSKYTPSGGRVEVAGAVEGDSVWVSVADTGIGIEADMLQGIFDIFAQIDRSLDRAQGGMGLGLTLVKSLVELHGGTVSATSAGLGRGSEFKLRLPIAHGHGEDNHEQPTVQLKPHSVRHVLLVEDSADNREMLRELLERDGFHVDVAYDGTDGVKQALSLKPDVAIVDIGLPVLDGFEVARRVRDALGPGIRLVALTGYGQPEDHLRTKQAGFDAHLTKPVQLAELEAALAPVT
jgi:signal transduction histidine kinase